VNRIGLAKRIVKWKRTIFSTIYYL
jgi:hypothetical protein